MHEFYVSHVLAKHKEPEPSVQPAAQPAEAPLPQPSVESEEASLRLHRVDVETGTAQAPTMLPSADIVQQQQSCCLPSLIDTLSTSIGPSPLCGPRDRLDRPVGFDNCRKNLILTDRGHYVVCDLLLTCTGGRADNFFMRNLLSHCLVCKLLIEGDDGQDDDGYIVVDQRNRLHNMHNMFAIGDCCNKGNPKYLSSSRMCVMT